MRKLRAEALCEGGQPPSFFCHIIQQRLEETHNSGGSVHTAHLRPWELILSLDFKSQNKAFEFERYLKTGSGRAFAQKRFW